MNPQLESDSGVFPFFHSCHGAQSSTPTVERHPSCHVCVWGIRLSGQVQPVVICGDLCKPPTAYAAAQVPELYWQTNVTPWLTVGQSYTDYLIMRDDSEGTMMIIEARCRSTQACVESSLNSTLFFGRASFVVTNGLFAGLDRRSASLPHVFVLKLKLL